MTEHDFFAGYDPAAFTPLAVAADVVLFTVAERQLRRLLVRRAEHPARGRVALPGSFVRPDEDLDDTARRTLRDKVGVDVSARCSGWRWATRSARRWSSLAATGSRR